MSAIVKSVEQSSAKDSVVDAVQEDWLAAHLGDADAMACVPLCAPCADPCWSRGEHCAFDLLGALCRPGLCATVVPDELSA